MRKTVLVGAVLVVLVALVIGAALWLRSRGGDDVEPRPPVPSPSAPLKVGKELSQTAGASIRRVLGDRDGSSWRVVRGEGNRPIGIEAENVNLSDILWLACSDDKPPPWFHGKDMLPKGFYDVSITVVPDSGDDLWTATEKAIEKTFALRITRRERTFDVRLLERIEGTPLHLTKVKPDHFWSHGTSFKGYEFKGTDMDMFATDFLSKEIGVPVLDETGLDGKYNFELPLRSTLRTTNKMIHEGLEKIGLKLTKTERTLPAVVIEKAGESRE